MQSEDFDNKIRKAADHHHPAYDEKAWEKMEQLLDKHLPQKKDNRRRFIFFLLLFLLLGGSAWLITTKPFGNNKSMTQVKQETPKQNPADDVQNDIKSNTSIKEDDKIKQEVNISKIEETKIVAVNADNTQSPFSEVSKKRVDKPAGIFTVQPNKQNTFFAEAPGKDKKQTRENLKAAGSNSWLKDKATNKLQQKPVNDILKVMIVENAVIDTKDNTPNVPVADKATIVKDGPTITTGNPTDSEQAGKEEKPMVEKAITEKAKNKKSNSFFFTLSAGPDISFAGSGKTGKAKLLAGAGLGYTFNNRFTIRTGFYKGRKIYAASAGEYHPPAGFYTYYPYLEKVDADCEVYEIPVSFSYNFSNSKKQNWFASTGLSSYLMKRESYTYFYKYMTNGPTIQKKWAIENQNKHYFSVLTLSGGYQRSLGKHLSIMAEPYVKVPLNGIGYGKVKLNSAGLLFSVGIKPFNTSKKQQR